MHENVRTKKLNFKKLTIATLTAEDQAKFKGGSQDTLDPNATNDCNVVTAPPLSC